MYIWADRLIDGNTTGIGGWEGSFNYTSPAIDMINKDVVLCDWHYERPDKTAPYFAAKGFRVITATWNRPAVALEQANDMQKFYSESTPEMKTKFLGMMQTVWSPVSGFFNDYYNKAPDTIKNKRSMGLALRGAFPIKGEDLILDPKKNFPIIAYVICKTPDQISKIDFTQITHVHFAFVNSDSSGNKDELKLPGGSTMYYNGLPTIRKKVRLAKKEGGGIMFWQVWGDTTGDKSLLRAINDEAYSVTNQKKQKAE